MTEREVRRHAHYICHGEAVPNGTRVRWRPVEAAARFHRLRPDRGDAELMTVTDDYYVSYALGWPVTGHSDVLKVVALNGSMVGVECVVLRREVEARPEDQDAVEAKQWVEERVAAQVAST